MFILDLTSGPSQGSRALQDELVRRGLRVMVRIESGGLDEFETVNSIIRDFDSAAYSLVLSPVEAGDGKKRQTWFEGKPGRLNEPSRRLPDPVGFDSDIGGEERGILEDDGPRLVERLTLWVKAWNR